MAELWTFKYEPKNIDEYICSEEIKEKLEKILNENLNCILSGPAGIGKSTFANIYLKDKECLKINASVENGVDLIRNKVIPFAHSAGMSNCFKIVYLNEAERLTDDAQEMLRQLIEDCQAHTRFIFICNNHNSLHKALFSRCVFIEMKKPPAKDIFKFCLDILEAENIDTSDTENIKKILLEIIKLYYPDIRKIINVIQASVKNNKLTKFKELGNSNVYEQIINNTISFNLNEVRTLLRNNVVDYTELYKQVFERIGEFSNIGESIIIVGEYLYRHNTITIPEINYLTMCAHLIKANS